MTYHPLLLATASQPVLQPKLKIGEPGHRYKREADAVTDQVMRMSDGESLQMQPLEEEEEMMMPKLQMLPKIQMQCPACQEEKGMRLQAKANTGQISPVIQGSGDGALYAEHSFSNRLKSRSGFGQPLPESMNKELGGKFGADFSRVRVHTDSKAAEMNRDIDAQAFTFGSDMYFNKGKYDPSSTSGKHLLAHELTHVVQQLGNRKMLQRSASALSRSEGISVQRNPDIPDFIDIVRRLHEAMVGEGVDEQAIFTALGELGGNREAGDELKRVYQNRYGGSLEADLRGVLSAVDFFRALELLNTIYPADVTTTPLQQERLAQLRTKVLSIDKDGTATMSLHQDTASGKISGYELNQAFRAEFDDTAIASNYAIIQWLRGELYEIRNGNRVYWPASMGIYGRSDTQPWRFTDWVIDTPDADPCFGSDRGVAVSVPTTQFDDSPGVIQNSGPLPAGLHWQVEARVGVYPWGAGVPKYIAGWESQRPQPFVERAWGWTVEVNTDQVSLNVNII